MRHFLTGLLIVFLLLLPFRAQADKVCIEGQPCGDACISWADTCHVDEAGDTATVLVILGFTLTLIVFSFYMSDPCSGPRAGNCF